MEDGALVLECLEDELLGDDDHQTAAAATEMPLPPFPPASQTPSASVRGGCAAPGCGSRPLVATRDDETPQSSTPVVDWPWEKN